MCAVAAATKVVVIFQQSRIVPKDFSGGPVVKNLPANAGDTGSIPCPGRSLLPQGNSAHVPQLLKPQCLKPVLHNKRSHSNEKPSHCNGE